MPQDPLQAEANNLLRVAAQPNVYVLRQKLGVGYQRARRLFDAAPGTVTNRVGSRARPGSVSTNEAARPVAHQFAGGDPLQPQADALLAAAVRPSITDLQVSLSVGYVRAARLYKAWQARTNGPQPRSGPLHDGRVGLRPEHRAALGRLAAAARKQTGLPTTVDDVLAAIIDNHFAYEGTKKPQPKATNGRTPGRGQQLHQRPVRGRDARGRR